MASEDAWSNPDAASSTAQVAAGSDVVTVNVDACRRLAGLLRSREIPTARENISLEGMRRQDVGNFHLLSVSVCHQTSPRGRPPLEGYLDGQRLRGWDYLSAKLEAAARADHQILLPSFWSRATTDVVRKLFHDEKLGDRLSDLADRASLIQDLGRKMLEHSWEHADQIYAASRGRIASGAPNLLGLLSEFRAYDDPLRKKSFFFLELMRNAGLWNYTDPEELGAPVDYHEVRGHLRLGTVEIQDPSLHAKLVEAREITPEQDLSIRKVVYSALMLVSEYSGLRNPGQLHYLFWNVFRSCCTRENPHCVSCPSNCSLPPRYIPLALSGVGPRRCPFSTCCRSAGGTVMLLEPAIKTSYY